MDKQVIDKIKQHRQDYPDDDNTYITSDGVLYDENIKLFAYGYAKNRPLTNVFIIPREMDLEAWYNQTFPPADPNSGFKMTFWVKIKLIWRYIFKTKK